MKILITGAKGFIGRNVVLRLKNSGYENIVEFDVDSPKEILADAVKDCGFVLHFAGVNRPKDDGEFMSGNFGFTTELLQMLEAAKNKSPILITSSIQAALDNPYGRSKKAAEDYIFGYAEKNGVKALVYRLPNVFGKWCRPNYNSAIATFCNNIANGLPIKVNDPSVKMHVVYIDDICDEILRALKGEETRGDGAEISGGFCMVPVSHRALLGEIVDIIYSFKKSRENFETPDVLAGSLSSKLYSTYLSYLPEGGFSYPLKMNVDARGSFTEFLRSSDRGQTSVNIAKPGIVKGNHWHNSKNEKFLVVCGKAAIRFRKIGTDKVIEYFASGEKLEVVDIPPGYTHNIENIGTSDLVTLMWANEPFNPENPDTYFEKV